ncbi:putative undecaprenyl-phosphate N-acetylglucosaminyl 1-phosphate transferase [Paraburkholderia saeva]|uniref:Undecaprenyl-phosphate N-acetylglucosaminyl 1-phosphate transferase n=1 Tax=Paraburkholderia saeva TaxID=2777537 RepID=A0A9N8RS19_9BURK|nr:putative undecaprenyl-phosphate N-acetylglucosaminyl 1-phosphate transferase [Paraburkholderia saeva]CAG4901813.1 putative undecaprenyl-phosphate N-acetylglucosaminyl 1-phosphate transferase [Paraburkholderia saeva]
MLTCAIVALIASAAILWTLLKTGLAWRLATDIPNDRSLHTRPTPRVGGWGIVPVVVILTLGVAPGLAPPVLAAMSLAILSQIDDRRGLPARVRFGGHVAAVAVLLVTFPVDIPWWALVLVGVLLVWLVNLYNFMDGADGLAGGMAVFGFGAYSIASLAADHTNLSFALACSAVTGAAAGFLFFNFHPAKIFLGDVGSIPLGFLAGAFGYWGWRSGIWPVWFPAVVFSPFISDASVTLLKRLLRGEKFWQAHREHYYQRMVQSGLGHANTARIWYMFMIVGILFAFCAEALRPGWQWLVVALWGVVLVLAGVCVDLRWRRYIARLNNPEVLRK